MLRVPHRAGLYRLGGPSFPLPVCWSCTYMEAFLIWGMYVLLPRWCWLPDPHKISNQPLGSGFPHTRRGTTGVTSFDQHVSDWPQLLNRGSLRCHLFAFNAKIPYPRRACHFSTGCTFLVFQGEVIARVWTSPSEDLQEIIVGAFIVPRMAVR